MADLNVNLTVPLIKLGWSRINVDSIGTVPTAHLYCYRVIRNGAKKREIESNMYLCLCVQTKYVSIRNDGNNGTKANIEIYCNVYFAI